MGFTQTITQNVPAVAQGATASEVIGKAPFDGTVTSVSYAPEAAMTGDATNKRVFTLVNKGADGNGTTVIATLDMAASVTADDFDDKAFTLSAVAGATTVNEGDVLAFVSTHAGTGIADPGGVVSVTIERETA